MDRWKVVKMKSVLSIWVLGLMATGAAGDTDKELLSKIAEAHRRIQSVHVTFSNRIAGQEHTDVSVWEWAMKGEKSYRRIRYGVDLDAPEGSEKRWGKCMWDGKLLRHYDSVSDNGAIRTKYDPYVSGSVTWNPYCRHFGTLMGVTLLSLIEELSTDDWEIVRDETGQKVVLSTDDLGVKDGVLVHRWHIDLSRGGMISRYQVELKRDNGLVTVSDMTVLEWRDMGNGLWLPSKSKTSFTAPDQPVHESTLILSKADVNEESIDRLFVDFEWPKGCQYYDETLGATVIPHATEKNMQAAVDNFALKALGDINSKLPQVAEGVRSPLSDSGKQASSVPARSNNDLAMADGASASYWQYLAVGIGSILILIACLCLWKYYRRNAGASV